MERVRIYALYILMIPVDAVHMINFILFHVYALWYRKKLEPTGVRFILCSFAGYTIPKGWVVLLYIPSVHVNPDKFPDPLCFNPSRWEDPHLGGNIFKPFGGGARLCVGMEFSKLLMAIFLHHLVTKYRWKTIKGGEMTRPTLTFPNGFHIQLFQRK